MDFAKWQSSAIWLSIRDIINTTGQSYHVDLQATLHTATLDYDLWKIHSLDIVRDYASGMMDIVQVKVLVPFGDYVYMIYPNKDNLELTITTKYLVGIGDAEDVNKPAEQIRYKAIFDNTNPSASVHDLANYSQQALNTVRMITIKLKLMDRNAEPLRVKTVQGIYRGVTNTQMIQSLLLGESANILVDGVPVVQGIDLVKPDYDTAFNQVVIPSGTHLCEIPTYLQQKVNGVYKYAIGTYYQRYNNIPMWFVYPLYNSDRFEDNNEKSTITFYAAPPQYLRNIEQTYKVNGNNIEAVITAQKAQMNTTDVTQLNHGVGVRMADQNAFMKKPVLFDSDGNVLGARGNLNNELSYISRNDGLNYLPVIKSTDTNMFHEVSKVSARQTTLMKFTWENSDPSLIYPGMPMKFCYMQDNNLASITGTILGIHSTRNRAENYGSRDRFTTHTVLSVAAQINTDLPVFDEENSFVAPTS